MSRVCPTMLVAAALFLAGCKPPPPTQFPPPRSMPTPPAPRTQGNANPPPQPPPVPPPKPPQDTPPLPPPPPPPTPETKPGKPSPEDKEKQRRSLVEVKFGRLDETTVDKKPFYSIDIELKNATGKDMKSFQGGLWFYDEAGKDLFLFGYTDEKPLKAGEARKAGFPILTISDDAVAYMKAHPDKVKVEFEADTVEYTDGTKAKLRR